MAAPVLILPVESRVRELDAKLLLAGVAAERGFRVILGSRQQVSFALPRLPRGVFFAKSMRFTSDLVTGFLRGFGHRLVASDEESLVRFRHADYCRWRFSPRTFSALEHLFAWGDDDAELFRAYPGRGEVAVHATGNPRADLLRPELREVYRLKAQALNRTHGRFILVNTNFSFVNNFVPALNLIVENGPDAPRVSRTGRGMSLAFAMEMWRHQHAIAAAFEALLPRLAEAFPGHSIIVRPHPSEDHDRWRRLTAALANVHVVHEDNVVPWLMAASVLLHNGCTTAVEGAVLGTPAVAYQPVRADDLDYPLPNGLSLSAGSEEAVLDATAAALRGQPLAVDRAHRNSLLRRHLALPAERLAADRIVDVLEGAGYLDRPPAPPPAPSFVRAWLGSHGRTVVKRVNMRRAGHRNGRAYLRHRFPPLGAGEVTLRLRNLGKVLGRFGGVEARAAGTDLFTIDKAREAAHGA